MLQADAVLLLQALKALNVQVLLVEEHGMSALKILEGTRYKETYCSVIGDEGSVTWGKDWDKHVKVAHAELAAPAIARTLPARCFSPKGKAHLRKERAAQEQPAPDTP